MRKLFASMFVLALAFAAVGLLYGQAGADTSKGSASVEVSDSSGAIVQGATVTLSGPMGNRTVKSDLRGQAVFYNLAPATYSVRVEFTGFRAAEVKAVAVSANQRSPIRVTLEPGAVSETVQVSERVATVDTTTTTTGQILAQEQYSNLPVGRNITALFSMAPGVVDGGGALGSTNPSISGATGLENQYIIDGINATDQGYGGFGIYSNNYGSVGSGVNFDFVKEVQVKTGGFEAQYGQALGGVVNIVTESGGNKMHGSAYAYGSPSWLEGTYKQPNDIRVAAPYSETWGRRAFDFGLNVGGPLVKDRIFWYGSFNPSYSTQDRMGPKGFGTRALGVQQWDRHNFNWVGKLNFNLSANHRLEASAFGDPSRDPMGVHRGLTALVRDDLDSASSNLYGTRNWSVKYFGLLPSNLLVTASFGWNHSYFIETPEKNLFQVRDYGKPKQGSTYTFTGGAGFIENSDADNRQYNTMLTKNVRFIGSHQFDLGYSYNQVDYLAYHGYTGPDWALPNGKGMQAANVGKMVHGGYFYFYPSTKVGGVTVQNVYRHVRGNFTDPNVGSNTGYQNIFLQDAWQMNKYLTIKAGVRWEQQQINGNVNTYVFTGNWAPRLGFIIDPTGSRKTKLYANWGRFYEKVPQDLAIRSMSMESTYNNGYFYGLPPTQANLVPSTVFGPYGVDPTVIYPGTKAQYQDEIVAGFEHELRDGLIVSARFVNRSLKRIIEDISGATVESADAGYPQNFVLANPSLSLDIFHNPIPCTSGKNCADGFNSDAGELGPDGKLDGFPDPRRVYKALELTAEKRFGNNWSLVTNYRLAKLFGDYEGLYRNDNGQSDPNITSLFDFMNSPAIGDQFKVGVLPTDRRHVANLYGSYIVGKRLNLGAGWQIQSGTPISKLLAHPSYGNAGEIPVGGRGAFGRTPTQNYLDLKIGYDLIKTEKHKVKVAADMFNLFNRKTITTIDQNFELDGGVSNADFLKAQAYHRPFYARFSLRYEF